MNIATLCTEVCAALGDRQNELTALRVSRRGRNRFWIVAAFGDKTFCHDTHDEFDADDFRDTLAGLTVGAER